MSLTAVALVCVLLAASPAAQGVDSTPTEAENKGDPTDFGIDVGQDVVDAFVLDLRKRGFPRSKLAIQSGPEMTGGRGVVATTSIAQHEEILAISVEFMMSTRSALASPLRQVILEDDSLIPPRSPRMLACHLVYERYVNANSTYAAHLAALPSSYDLPILWSKQELKQLKGSRAYDMALNDRKALANEYNQVVWPLIKKWPQLFPASAFTKQRYFWAMATVWSRTFGADVSGTGESESVLIPFLDYMNHRLHCKTTGRYDAERGVFIVEAGDAYSRGDEVFLSYRDHPNVELLLDYGFVIEDNQLDYVMLDMPLHLDEPFDSQKLDILKQSGRHKPNSFRIFYGKNPDLLPAWRIMAIEPSDLEFLGMYLDTSEETGGEMVTADNEVRATKLLRGTILSQLAAYPTTYQEDQELWSKRGSLSWRHRMALVVRISEKKLLTRVAKQLETALKRYMEEFTGEEPSKLV